MFKGLGGASGHKGFGGLGIPSFPVCRFRGVGVLAGFKDLGGLDFLRPQDFRLKASPVSVHTKKAALAGPFLQRIGRLFHVTYCNPYIAVDVFLFGGGRGLWLGGFDVRGRAFGGFRGLRT